MDTVFRTKFMQKLMKMLQFMFNNGVYKWEEALKLLWLYHLTRKEARTYQEISEGNKAIRSKIFARILADTN